MCYDVAYLTKRIKRYKEHYKGVSGFEEAAKKTPSVYHVSGFEHADMPVITNEKPDRISLFTWGLIPSWVKDSESAVKISNSTINARGEEMFEKPSFKYPAKHQRCLVVIDGFYEHHWKNDKSYPYFIQRANDAPMTLAGLWSRWEMDDMQRETCSIITCEANPMMKWIHNKPRKSEGPRMPLILDSDHYELWLDTNLSKEEVLKMVKPFDETLMKSHTTQKLRGKAYLGNVPETMKKHRYEELETNQGSLF